MDERVAIYARVSTDEQTERQTIDNQLVACREYCSSRGLEVVAEFKDEGISGTIPLDERPEGHRLLEVAGDGLFHRVVVYRLDRLARDVPGGILAYRRLQALGAPVVSASESWDDTPSGKLVFNLFISIAEFEKDLIRERTSAGRRRRVRSGKYQASHPPFGYVYDRQTGQLGLHRENAAIVRQMFQWARDGAGLKTIASRLEEKGVAPPSPSHPKRRSNWGWHFTTVYKILTAPRYTGHNTYGGEPMTCPAIVDEETLSAVQEALRRRKLNSRGNTKHFYLLQHLVYCRACGSRYMARTVTQRGGPVGIYACRQRTVYGPKAGHEGIRWRWHAEELETRVKRHVLKTFVDPEYLVREAKSSLERVERDAGEREDRESSLGTRLAGLAQEELRVLDWARKGYIDDTRMLEQLEKVRAERQEVQAELGALQQRPASEISRTELQLILLNLQTAEFFRWARELVPRVDDDDTWTDDSLRLMAELPAGLPGIDEGWLENVRSVVNRVWVENDGSITIEGVLPGLRAEEERAFDSPRSR